MAATLIWLRQDAPHPAFQSAGVASYALAAPLTAICAQALGRPGLADRARRTLICFHLLFIPLQFFFLLAHKVPFAGMLLSSMIVVRMRPRFPRLRRRSRKVWLTLHVGVSVGWLGLSLAMATLAVVGAGADDHVVRHGAYELMHVEVECRGQVPAALNLTAEDAAESAYDLLPDRSAQIIAYSTDTACTRGPTSSTS